MLFMAVRTFSCVSQQLSLPNLLRFCLYPNCVKTCPIPQLFEYFPICQRLSLLNCYYDFGFALYPSCLKTCPIPNCPNIFLYHNCYLCSNVTKICIVSQLSKDLSYSPTKILPVSQMCEDLPDSPTVRIFSWIPTAIFSQLLLRFCLYPKCVRTCPIPQLFEYFPVSKRLSFPNC